MTAPQPVYLKAENVADEIMSCSKSHVYRLAKADPTMPCLRINGILRFPRERLLLWLRQREQGSVPRLRTSYNGRPSGHRTVDAVPR